MLICRRASLSCNGQALLRAKALECISLVGMAVGRDRFRADAHEVMKVMQALQAQELDPDDPTGGYMLQVCDMCTLILTPLNLASASTA